MDWSSILSIPPNELAPDELDAIPNHLSSVNASVLSVEELRKFFELNRFLINRLNDTPSAKNLGSGESNNTLLKKKKKFDSKYNT